MPMTPERLKRIRAIYEATLQLQSQERAAFISDQSGNDDEIVREVELLLQTRDQITGWLTGPLFGPAESFAGFPAPLRMEGRQIGNYKLVKEIGTGGMGSVYLAERIDGTFHKHVAIKLVRPGMNSAEILERFRREREILATLDHPNIARLIDGGETEEGLPYFIMEFVDGQPIHRWCDEHKLNITERIDLFRNVCAAVQYAHQRLVVHRDIKPGNIFVTADGTVKLLDFGIAKVLGPPAAGNPGETMSRLIAMTPEYASPEQVKGESITIMTDVYSLGVVLYELLTGHRPYRVAHAALHEVARVISEEEPTRPSLVITTTDEKPEGQSEAITPEVVSSVREGDPVRLRKRLEGDLDSILLAALRKEPGRRYTSVEAFADDLQRHLAHLPVNARGDSLWYRTGRFVRRHPGAVIAAIVILLSNLIGMFTTLWEARIVLDATRQKLPTQAVLVPEIALFSYLGLLVFGVAAFLTRATWRRLVGAMAGGIPFALIWLLRFKVGYSMGWWRTNFPDAPDPAALFSIWLLVILMPFLAAAVFLVSWRIARRFGWAGCAIYILALAADFSFRDRVYWDYLMRIMVASSGLAPISADAAFFAIGLTAGHVVMRIVAGPARNDVLSSTPLRMRG